GGRRAWARASGARRVPSGLVAPRIGRQLAARHFARRRLAHRRGHRGPLARSRGDDHRAPCGVRGFAAWLPARAQDRGSRRAAHPFLRRVAGRVHAVAGVGRHRERQASRLGRDRGDEDDDRPRAVVTRIGVQDRLVPGGTLSEKFEAARRFGFDALELSQRPAFDEARTAIRERIPVTAIAGGYRGWLIDPDPENVAAARTDIAELLGLAGELGTGIVIVPIW